MSTIYMKHPELGNKHVPAAEQAAREADGWVKWPRTAAQKAGGEPPAEGEAPARKKPGPKPKA